MIAKSLYYFDKACAKLSSKQKIKINTRRQFSYRNYLTEIEDDKELSTQSFFLVSVDDTSLKKSSFVTSDNGADKHGAVRKFLLKLINNDIKLTIYFVPCPTFGYLSDVKRKVISDKFDILINKEHEFVHWLKYYENLGKLEICVHGYNHLNPSLTGYYSFEFDGTSNQIMKEKLLLGYQKMASIFKINGFKPPAWSIGNLTNTSDNFIRCLKQINKYRYVSLSSPTNGLNYSKYSASHVHPNIIKGLLNIPQNISILWPLDYIKLIIDKIIKKGGIINIQLHSQSSFRNLEDGLCSSNFQKLLKIRDYLFSKKITALTTNRIVK